MRKPSLETGPIVLGTARRVSGFFHFWWYKVPEPRVVSLVTGFVYLVFLATGVVTVLSPPVSVEGIFGEFTMQVVGSFLIGGSVIGIVGGVRDFWALERVGIVGMGFGLMSYFYMVLSLQGVVGSGSRFTQLGVILAALGFLILRLSLIWRYTYKPRR